VPVYGLGIDAGGRPFYAMRFIRGDSLKTAIAGYHADGTLKQTWASGRWRFGNSCRRFVDVCHAIDRAQPGRSASRLEAGEHHRCKHGETLVVDWGWRGDGAK